MNRDIEESLAEAKEEMKQYIEETMKKFDSDNKKKFTELESGMRRMGGGSFGGQSPTSTGQRGGGRMSMASGGGRGQGSQMR